jgi:uroporphyrinogen decarboxylase
MLPRERVIATIRREPRDRIPVYGWVAWNLREKIDPHFGSPEALEDHYEFDYAHLFGGPACYAGDAFNGVEQPLTPRALLDVAMTDPNDGAAYADLVAAIAHHQGQRGRFVYVQTPGIFEALNGVFGIENHLLYLGLYPDDLHAVYQRQAEWNRAFALNCLALGVDMVHVSDDWGGQEALLFSPRTWWSHIFPYHKIVCDAVKAASGYLSLHSDGNVTSVLDGVVELGYDVVHPYQESAGMSYDLWEQRYRDSFVLMGGLDVQTTIGFGKLDFLEAEIRRVLTRFRDGGMLYCTTHFIQDHCSLEELVFAYDLIFRLVRNGAG